MIGGDFPKNINIELYHDVCIHYTMNIYHVNYIVNLGYQIII